ncbi:MAG: hypothetical protein JO170_04585, partial [Verrucomicrobia bacterium]|nr:hypothetical protein [Verrucomicrobiota bacterium]
MVENTKIVLPSGAITFTAQNGIALGSGADISVAGEITPFFDVVRIAPAGSLTLQTTNGNVVVAPGAVVNVSGSSLSSTTVSHLDVADSDTGGDAGTFTVIAPNGAAELGGSFLGTAPQGYTGGKVILNLNSGDASSLLGAVTTFTGEQSLTLATGDISVGNITAQDVELSASTGSVLVYGTINASGPSGGTIRLTAGVNLTLASTAILDASATSTEGAGGIVFLGLDGKSSGTLTLAGGSIIDVSGTGPNGNEVWLRAPRINDTGVAISNQGVTVAGADKLIVEGVAVYDVTSNPYVDQNLTTTSQAVVDANNFMANASAINASLGSLASNPAYQLLPGIELGSNGNLTLLTNPSNSTGNPYAGTSYIYNDGIDLGGLRFNGAPGVLTLRAADNLIINGSLSDGFSAPVVSPDGPIFAIAPLAGGPSWSLRLIGGADLKAADPLGLIAAINVPAASTNDPEPGSVIFNAPYLVDSNGSSPLGAALEIPSVVRTGTGDLELAAAGNIDIQTEFGIYTAGQPSAAVAGFTMPVRQYISSVVGNNSYLGYQSPGVPWDNTYPTALYPSYPTGGGNLTVKVEGSLVSQSTNLGGYAGSELDPYWLWTEPNQASPTWFINFGTYYQDMAYANSIGADIAPTVAGFLGLGALGGGNVNVSVGGNMTNVDVSLPTTGRVGSNNQVVITGGGNLNLSVGGSLNDANLYVGKGTALIEAADMGTAVDSQGVQERVNFMISDSQFTVYSQQNIYGLIGDPTRTLRQNNDGIAEQEGGWTQYWGLEGLNPGLTDPANAPVPYGFFGSMTANSSFSEFAAGGDVTVLGSFAPPILSFVAANGSIMGDLSFRDYLVALPAPTARLSILAQQDVRGFGVSMTAADMSIESNGVYLQPSGIPDLGMIAAPSGYDYPGTILDAYEYIGPVGPAGNVFVGPPSNLVLSNDPHTVVVYAVEGSLNSVALATPERVLIRAGLDIVQPVFNIENTSPNDSSLVEAGRDITSAQPGGILGTDVFNIRVEGPGTLVVQAGRNIVSEPGEYNTQGIGIESVGNTDNPYYLLPGGANIDISVGVGLNGADITGFINTYLNPANAGSVQKNYLPRLVAYMNQLEGSTLTSVEALADFEQ